MQKTIVKVFEKRTDKVVKSIDCHTDREAQKVERGINININHDKFYTETEVIE